MESIPNRFARFTELVKDIDYKICRIEELEATMGGAGAPSFGSVGHGKGGHTDRTAYLAAKIADLRDDLAGLVEQERTERKALEAILRTAADGKYLLSTVERTAIQTRYFDGLTFALAAEAMDMSEKGVKVACDRGFRKLDMVYNGKEV